MARLSARHGGAASARLSPSGASTLRDEVAMSGQRVGRQRADSDWPPTLKERRVPERPVVARIVFVRLTVTKTLNRTVNVPPFGVKAVL